MKKLIILVTLLSAIVLLQGNVTYRYDFCASAQNVNAGVTYTKSSWTAAEQIRVSQPRMDSYCSILITFTRAAGAASTADFYFQVSQDHGTTWAHYDVILKTATNTTAISGTTVNKVYLVYLHGISHIRLWKIVNGDGANNLTACNATLAIADK